MELQELGSPTLRILIVGVAYWCLDPGTLLNLSSTCKDFAKSLRKSSVWLSHHQARGYDIGVLKKKAERAASANTPRYGKDGWRILVKSAFDKAEFPDDNHITQWKMGKPLPHFTTQQDLDADAIDKYQDHGDKWMRVFYDILTEHGTSICLTTKCNNLKLYPYLHDEALQIRVRSPQGKYFQALICASALLIEMWTAPVAVINTHLSCHLSGESLEEIPPHDESRTTLKSLTRTFLIAKKIMEIDPSSQEAQTQRRLYPHPPFGASIWEGPNGEIDPKGLGWIQKVMNEWKGRVYVVGQYTIFCRDWPCPFNKMKLGPQVFRMCLDFQADGRITGRGGDFGGSFYIVSGSYHKTFVKLVKLYKPDDDGDIDIYHAQGHMTPWGVFGTWNRPQDPTVLGYWVMWLFEGAPPVQFGGSFRHRDGTVTHFNQEPYRPSPGWFEEYERLRKSGNFKERRHGYWGDPAATEEDPAKDACGLV